MNRIRRLQRLAGLILFCILLFFDHREARADYPTLKNGVDWDQTTKTITISEIDSEEGVLGYMKSASILKTNTSFKSDKVERAVIKGNFINIPAELFKDCRNLKTVEFPDTIKIIEAQAFYNCESLENLALPGSVNSIGSMAFVGCSSLVSITIPAEVESLEGQEDLFDAGSAVIIYGVPGSAAERYAKSLGLTFDGSHALEIIFIDSSGDADVVVGKKSVLMGSLFGDLSAFELMNQTGYTFQGYYTAREGGQKLTSNTKANEAGTMYAYAQWLGASYQVTFENQGKKIDTKQVVYGAAYGDLPSGLSQTGSTFLGWYVTNANGTKTKVTAASKVKTAANHTLTAEWKLNTYTIKIVKNGGSGSGSVSFAYGAKTKAPTLKSSTMKFIGWYSDKKYKTKFKFGEKMPASNLTVYAKWFKLSSLKKPVVSAKAVGSDLKISIGKIAKASSYVYEISTDKNFKKNVISVKSSKTSISLSSIETEKKHIKNFSRQYIRVRARMKVSDGKDSLKEGKNSLVKATGVLVFQPVVKIIYDNTKGAYKVNIKNFGNADRLDIIGGTTSSARAEDEIYYSLSRKTLAGAGLKISNLKDAYFQFLTKANAKARRFQIVYFKLTKGSKTSKGSKTGKVS